MRNPKRFFEAATIAAKAIRVMGLEGGEEGVKFFFNCFTFPISALSEAQIKKAVEEMKTVAEPPAKPTTIVLAPAPAPTPVKLASAPATAPPRTLRLNVGGSDFAAKLNGVAAEMHLGGEKSPLGKFRDLMLRENLDDDGWLGCREATTTVLSEKLFKEESDWKLLVNKMKRDRFFLDPKSSEMFLFQCPKKLIADLLLAGDGLWNLMEEIREERELSATSPHRVSFIIDACVMVGGKDAYTLLTKSKDAVNRMKMRSLIPINHWLVQKVAAMKQPKPARPTVTPVEMAPEEPAQAEVVTDHKLDNLQQVAEAVAEAEAPTLTEDKPAVLDLEFEKQFSEMMLAADATSSTAVN